MLVVASGYVVCSLLDYNNLIFGFSALSSCCSLHCPLRRGAEKGGLKSLLCCVPRPPLIPTNLMKFSPPFHFLPLLHQYGKYKFYCLQHYYVFLLSSYFLYNHKSVFLLFLCVFFLQLKFILKLPFSLWLSQYHSILHVPNFLLMFLVFLFSLICSWSSICFYSLVAILSYIFVLFCYICRAIQLLVVLMQSVAVVYGSAL